MMFAKLSKVIATGCLLLALPALALTLDEAKSSGQVGEQADGYLGTVNANPSAAAKALVKEINGKRHELYLQKAAKAGVATEIMEQRTGERLQQMTPAGEYIQRPDGSWMRK